MAQLCPFYLHVVQSMINFEPKSMKNPFVNVSSKDLKVSVWFLLTAVALVVSAVAAWQHFLKTPPYVDPVRYPVKGIDVSSHNGMMNLDAAADDGIRFIFIKASEGADFHDENFRINYQKARHAGMKIGAYHFFRFDRDGVDQARNLISAIRGRHLDLGVAIDVETSGNPTGIDSTLIADRLTRMADFLNLNGYKVTVYSNTAGYFSYIRESLPGTDLWICSFSPTPINTEWTFWQYNHRGKVKGINGDEDMNVFCGSESDWRNYLDGAVWPFESAPAHTDTE